MTRSDVSIVNGASNGALIDVSGAGGGSITINSRNLEILGGATTPNLLNAGIAVEAASGAQMLNTTSTSGRAGDTIIHARERFTLSGADTGVFSSTIEGSTGEGGSIKLDSPEVTLSD